MLFDKQYKSFILKNSHLPSLLSGDPQRDAEKEYFIAKNNKDVTGMFINMFCAVKEMRGYKQRGINEKGVNFLAFINTELPVVIDCILAKNTKESLANSVCMSNFYAELFDMDSIVHLKNVEKYISIQNAIVGAALKLKDREYPVAIKHGLIAGETVMPFFDHTETPELRNLQETVVRNFIKIAKTADNDKGYHVAAQEAATYAQDFTYGHPDKTLIAEATALKLRIVEGVFPDRTDNGLCRKPAAAHGGALRQ